MDLKWQKSRIHIKLKYLKIYHKWPEIGQKTTGNRPILICGKISLPKMMALKLIFCYQGILEHAYYISLESECHLLNLTYAQIALDG